MLKDVTNSKSRTAAFAAVLVAIAFSIVPAAALAQDPAVDQYAPTTPSGGPDGVPATGGPEPQPTATPDGGSGTETPIGSDAGSNPSSTPTSDPASPAVTPAVADDDRNKAQRTVDDLAADARANRPEPTAASGDSRPTAELLSNDSATGSGMGAILWIVLGGTLLWALIAGGLAIKRRRGADSTVSNPHDASPRERGEGHQPA